MPNVTVAIDAGHGGSDPGAVYNGRKEKDDTLRLALAVGSILSANGINVFYVRNDDVYETPFKKATDANNSGADYFVSIHRNSSETANKYNGVETLVYKESGTRLKLAENINTELGKTGFKVLGVKERPNLVVLKRTKMPAVLVEVGFINNDSDNKIFDENFDKIAQAIANGILNTIYASKAKTTSSENVMMSDKMINDSLMTANSMDNSLMINNSFSETEEVNEAIPVSYSEEEPSNYVQDSMPVTCTKDDYIGKPPEDDYILMPQDKLYRIQVGAYKNKENADRMLDSLLIQGFPAFMIYEDGLYKVQVGAFTFLTNAIKQEKQLRRYRYSTYIVYK